MEKNDRFTQLIQKPLQQSDPSSFNRIKSLMESGAGDRKHPFSQLIKKLTGKSFPEDAAVGHWKHILENKAIMEAKLGRMVSIQTAAVDHFSVSSEKPPLKQSAKTGEPAPKASKEDEWVTQVYSPSLYQEKLREEISRARRYNHALSAILLDVDEFHRINEELSVKTGDEILTLVVKIIKKTIRNVDIMARYSGDRFLIILPNTNQREAVELAERIRQNVYQRTERMHNLAHGITVTLSVRQCPRDEKAGGFVSNIERVLKIGKKQGRNAVYSPEDVTSASVG